MSGCLPRLVVAVRFPRFHAPRGGAFPDALRPSQPPVTPRGAWRKHAPTWNVGTRTRGEPHLIGHIGRIGPIGTIRRGTPLVVDPCRTWALPV